MTLQFKNISEIYFSKWNTSLVSDPIQTYNNNERELPIW